VTLLRLLHSIRIQSRALALVSQRDVDSFARYIYVHGSPKPVRIPSSFKPGSVPGLLRGSFSRLTTTQAATTMNVNNEKFSHIRE